MRLPELSNCCCLPGKAGGSPFCTREERVTVGLLVDTVGRRSFGPLLLVVGLVILSPLSGIPGVPTVLSLLMLLVALQLLLRRRHFYFPRWLLGRSLRRGAVLRGLRWLQRPAGTIDRFLKPRFTQLTGELGNVVIALICVMVSLAMPVMELLPFSASAAGLVLTLFGLSLVFHDGVLALLALILYAVVIGGLLLGF